MPEYEIRRERERFIEYLNWQAKTHVILYQSCCIPESILVDKNTVILADQFRIAPIRIVEESEK